MSSKRDMARLQHEYRVHHAEIVPVNAWRCRDCDWFCIKAPGRRVLEHEQQTGHRVRCPPL